MSKKRNAQVNQQSHVLPSKSDKSSAKTVTLSNEFIASFTQIIFQDT